MHVGYTVGRNAVWGSTYGLESQLLPNLPAHWRVAAGPSLRWAVLLQVSAALTRTGPFPRPLPVPGACQPLPPCTEPSALAYREVWCGRWE